MSAQLEVHGLSAIEAAIMDRFDAGERARDIAAALQLGHRRVESVIQMFQEGRSDAWEAPVRRGSIELLAAIRRLQARASA